MKLIGLLILSSMTFSFSSFAEKLSQSATTTPPNLIEESNTLKIQNEDTIQSEVSESERIYGLRIGQVQGDQMLISLESEQFIYDLSQDVTEVGARFGIYPYKGLVDVGIESGVSYFSLNNQNVLPDRSNAAKLHVIGLEGMLSFKHRLSFAQWLIPQASIGGGVKGLFQRGYNDENTSVSRGFGVALVALNFDLSRFKNASGLDWGLFVDGRQYFGGASNTGVTDLVSYSMGLNIKL